MNPTITIAGQSYPVAFDFATIIRYEELTGHPFSLEGIAAATAAQLDLYLSAITSVTPTAFPDGRFAFYKAITLKEATEASRVMAPLIEAFFATPATLPDDSGETTDDTRQDP